MKAECEKHGVQEFTPPDADGSTYCARCVALVNSQIGMAIYEDLFWRKYGDNLRRAFADTSTAMAVSHKPSRGGRK